MTWGNSSDADDYPTAPPRERTVQKVDLPTSFTAKQMDVIRTLVDLNHPAAEHDHWLMTNGITTAEWKDLFGKIGPR